MSKVLLFILILAIASCNSKPSTTTTDAGATGKGDTTKKAISYLYPINYSAQFEMGDPEKSNIVLSLWKDFENNALDNSRDRFADSVEVLLPGMEMHTSRDSMLSTIKAYRGSFNAVTNKVDAVISTRSTDRNEDWVLIWGTEIHTNKKNVIDSVHLHEIWRINKNGKVDFIEQFIRPGK